jgi:hypothetical protein
MVIFGLPADNGVMPERMVDAMSKKTNREKALVLVAVLVLIGAGAVALFGVGLARWAASECTPGHCDGTKQITLAIAGDRFRVKCPNVGLCKRARPSTVS